MTHFAVKAGMLLLPLSAFAIAPAEARIACHNGYQIVMVRNIRECGFGTQRRVVVNGGKRRLRAQGGYAHGGGYAYGGGYATGGGFGYAYRIDITLNNYRNNTFKPTLAFYDLKQFKYKLPVL